MENLPAYFAFYGGESREEIQINWTDKPLPSDGFLPAFFSADLPFFATKFAIDIYGEEILLSCLAFLRIKAQKLGGIDAFQRLFDTTGSGPSILFAEDWEDDFSLMEGMKPWRITASLNGQFLVHDVAGDKWIELTQILRRH